MSVRYLVVYRGLHEDVCYLDTKIKNTEKDPEEKWITSAILSTFNRYFLSGWWITNAILSTFSRYFLSGLVLSSTMLNLDSCLYARNTLVTLIPEY